MKSEPNNQNPQRNKAGQRQQPRAAASKGSKHQGRGATKGSSKQGRGAGRGLAEGRKFGIFGWDFLWGGMGGGARGGLVGGERGMAGWRGREEVILDYMSVGI